METSKGFKEKRCNTLNLVCYHCENLNTYKLRVESKKDNRYVCKNCKRTFAFPSIKKNICLTKIDNLEETLGLIYGTLLGDSSIVYPNNQSNYPRVSGTQGLIQKEWAKYKVDKLSNFFAKYQIIKNKGFGDFSVIYRTSCHYSLIEVFNNVTQNKKKKVSLEWLNKISDEGIAWWYMDDGSLNKRKYKDKEYRDIRFHTQGYSKEENYIISDWLTKKGYPNKLSEYFSKSRNKTYSYIRLQNKESIKFINNFKKYVAPSMEYKFC